MTALSVNRLDRVTGIRVLEIRGHAGDAGFLTRIASVVGTLPARVGTADDDEDHAVLCLSPDRWWISGSESKITGLEIRLRETLKGVAHAMVPLSAGLASFRLTGPNAVDILAKGTAIDLDPAALSKGSVRRVLHAGISTVIHRHRHAERDAQFDLHVQRSYQHYARSWLLLAGQDYALTAGEEWSN